MLLAQWRKYVTYIYIHIYMNMIISIFTSLYLLLLFVPFGNNAQKFICFFLFFIHCFRWSVTSITLFILNLSETEHQTVYTLYTVQSKLFCYLFSSYLHWIQHFFLFFIVLLFGKIFFIVFKTETSVRCMHCRSTYEMNIIAL